MNLKDVLQIADKVKVTEDSLDFVFPRIYDDVLEFIKKEKISKRLMKDSWQDSDSYSDGNFLVVSFSLDRNKNGNWIDVECLIDLQRIKLRKL